MPQVKAPEQTIVTAPLPGPRATAAFSAEGLGAGIGNTLMQLGTGILAAETAKERADEKAREAAAERARELADQVRVDDALNKVRERSLDLTFGKTGYSKVAGRDAIERASKMPLAEEYAGELDKYIQELMQSLSSDEQRQRFSIRANDVRTSFYGNALRHESEQSQKHQKSVDDGTIAIAHNTIGRFYHDPDQVDEAVRSIQAAVARTGRMLGLSATEIESDTRKATSKAHMLAVAAALQKNAPLYAEAYLRHYSEQMEAGDILKAQDHITKEVDVKIGQQAADKVFTRAVPAIHSYDFERVVWITKRRESNNRQFDAKGKPLRSSAGAIGIMQVLEGTGPEAAKLAGLPWDRDKWLNDAEYNEAIGRAYLAKQLRDFGGDLGRAWAAYNGGPAATKAAIAKGNDDYLKYLPKETQDYVTKNIAEYQSGAGNPRPPTLEDLQEQLRADPTLAARPLALKIALDAVAHRYTVAEKAVKQGEETAVANAQRWLIENNGNFVAMPAALRGAIPPGKYDDMLGFAGKVAKGVTIETDWLRYEALRTEARNNPTEFVRRDIAASFSFLAPAQRESLIDLQDKIKKDPNEVKDVATLEAQLAEAHERMSVLGDGNAKKRGIFDEIVRDEISAKERQIKRKLDYEERKEIVLRNERKVPGSGLFSDNRGYEQTVYALNKIPVAERSRIEQKLRSIGKLVNARNILDMYDMANEKPALEFPAATGRIRIAPESR